MLLRAARRVVSVLLIAILLAAGIVPTASASISAKVNTSSAKIYQSASKTAKSVKVPKNLKVSITSISGNWAKVSYKGNTAYMPMKNLSPTSRKKGYAKGSTTVYNSSGKKMGSLKKGSGVYVLGTINGGYCVMNSSGLIGYVKSGTLTNQRPDVSNVKKVPLSKVDAALTVARSLIGRRYALNDNPPSSFNCSSFVQYCLGKAGCSMRGTAAAQASDSRYQKITSLSSLRKGDVLCFDTSGDGRVDHSAIYIGSGQFIEASHNAGKVQTNSLTSWYKSHFICARRP